MNPERISDAVAALARVWPDEGGRHAAYRALAGGLLRVLPEATVEKLITALVEATDDDDATDRLALVRATAEKLVAGAKVEGWPTLARALGSHGDRVVNEVRGLLGCGTITLADLAMHKRLSVEWLRSLGLHDLPDGGIAIPYHDITGKVLAVKKRTALAAKDGSFWPKGKPVLAYGEERLDASRQAGFLILVEGESDCWTLWHRGIPALGLPGSDTVKKALQLGHVSGLPQLYTVEEPDASGRKFTQSVAERLRALGWVGDLRVIRLDGAKDPSELHCQGEVAFTGAWQRAVQSAAPLRPKDTTPAAGATAPRSVRAPVPFCPFPVEALPEPVASLVRQGAAAIGCDTSYLALPALAVLASLIGNTRAIRLKRGWTEPVVLWAVIIGDSGTLKSPPLQLVVDPLFRLQRQWIEEFNAAFEHYEAEKDAYDAAKRAAKGKKGDTGAVPDKPTAPTCRRLACSDVTIERLAGLLEENPRGLLVWRDELSGWLTSFTRYKGKNGGSDLPNWLEMHRASTVVVDRKTGDKPLLYVPRAAASITGGIQPRVLARCLTPDFFDAGLVARLLLTMPPKMSKCWSEVEIAPEVMQAYEGTVQHLLALEFDKDDRERPAPFVVRMTPEAKSIWVDFYNSWAREQATADGELAAAFSKLEGTAPRLALIHHVVTHAAAATDCDPVEPVSMLAAIEMVKWFARETRRVYGILGETEEDRQTRRLVEFIRAQGGKLTPRTLQRARPSVYQTAEDAAAALKSLAEAGLGEWAEALLSTGKGRPPSPTFLLTSTPSTIDTIDNNPDDEDDDEGGILSEPFDNNPPPPTNPSDFSPSVNSVNCQSSVCRSGEGSGKASEQGNRLDSADGLLSVPPGVSPDGGKLAESASAQLTKDRIDKKPAQVDAPAWLLVRNATDLFTVRDAVEQSGLIGLDIETTGLNPRRDRIRLLSLATDCGLYLVDCFAVDPSPLWPILAERPVVAHNALFDLSFLQARGFEPGTVHDTMILSQLLHGTRHAKGFHGLGQVVERELGKQLDKEQQKSDWSGDLTPEQLEYAATDAAILPPLYRAMRVKITEAKLTDVAQIESRCLPGMVWLSSSGVAFNRNAWLALAQEAEQEKTRLGDALDVLAPAREGYLQKAGSWNWDSPAIVKEAFAALGITLESTDDDALAAVDHPLAALVREYRSAAKLASTYGPSWIKKAYDEGRLYVDWRQLGCLPGRMSSAGPNLQNLPGDPQYRRCFWAPPGRVLVKADYSQIELRIAAKVTGEKAMLDAYERGDDLHTLTARRMLDKQDVTSAERKLAKPVNFGLIYGLGVPSLRRKAKADYGLDLSEEEARRYRSAFFAAYPAIKRWHRSIEAGKITETRTRAGRRVVVKPDDFFGGKANYVVQGTGADGMKQALALLWERRADCPGAFPVLVVHDEIVVECDEAKADHAAAWLKSAMIDGMKDLIAPVPVEVEVTIGQTWGG